MKKRKTKKQSRALVQWNTGQRTHTPAKGKGSSTKIERRKAKLGLKNELNFLIKQ